MDYSLFLFLYCVCPVNKSKHKTDHGNFLISLV